MFSKKVTTFLILTIALFWAYVSSGSAAMQSSGVLSVCDILADAKKYDRQIVTIRAALVPSLNDTSFDELAPLVSERCYSPRRLDKLRIGISGGYMPDPPPGFKPDLDSYDRAAKILGAILDKDPQTRRLLVTVVGIIYKGGPEPSGVTRDAWYPVLMLISSWKEVQKP